ncbi:MAG: adenine phosphoribosyltransferase [Ignavibacteriales bacterium]|nr:adenine phosphoribosyltransferase [Ignavibacteriales bacterium]
MSELASYIRNVPDFPKKGIVFRDITTLLKEPGAVKKVVSTFYEKYCDAKIDKIVGVESRGFILGSALAFKLGIGFIPIRKKGKLPAETVREEYSLEYGTDTIEIHKDALQPGERVLIHDDLLATGGTMSAACKLIERAGGKVAGVCFLVELNFLKGRDRLKNYDVFSLIQYDHE